MKQFFSMMLLVAALSFPLNACAQENLRTEVNKSEGMTQYMFVGHVSPKGWQYLLDNPNDREEAARIGVNKMGGKLHAYYFGFGNSKNYVIASLPDKKTAKAAQILRLSSGLLIDYEIIELMSPADIEAIALDMQRLRDMDDIQKGE